MSGLHGGEKREGERGAANEQIMKLIFMSQMLMKTKFNTRCSAFLVT